MKVQRRTIGEWIVEVDRTGQPEGWSYVRLIDLNGAAIFVGVVQTEELPIELLVQIECAREYMRLLRAERPGVS